MSLTANLIPRSSCWRQQRLGVPASSCVVIEDAAAGVEAAMRAGMASVGFCSKGRTPGELADADLVVASLADLGPAVLKEAIDAASRRNGST